MLYEVITSIPRTPKATTNTPRAIAIPCVSTAAPDPAYPSQKTVAASGEVIGMPRVSDPHR